MTRPPRLVVPGVPLHITQRGVDRGETFIVSEDYAFYRWALREAAAESECSVHAYVLMTNHVHLLMTAAKDDGPSLLMKHLGQRYVQYVNRLYGRSGTMWEGRFRSSIVQQRAYLLRCHRCIELNPVRAGMVSHPAEYRWSSYRANAGHTTSSLVTPHAEYLALGNTDQERTGA